MSKQVLVSVASMGREAYPKAQLNLIKSALDCKDNQRNWYGDFMMRSVDGYCDNYMGVPITLGSWPVTKEFGVSWSHQNRPYGFKPFAVWEAIEAGYTKILWCDSTIRLMKNPEPLWEKCADKGILAWNNEGHPVMPYTPVYMERWLTENGYTTGEKQIMACCIMFDIEHPSTLPIIQAWIKGAMDECFHHHAEDVQREGFKGSRHDQALLSHLMANYGIEIEPYGTLSYRHYQPIEPTFINWGVND